MKEISALIGRMYHAKWIVMLSAVTLPAALYIWLDLIYRFLGFMFE